jgi:uncharacterized RDD family membrane protein YckC
MDYLFEETHPKLAQTRQRYAAALIDYLLYLTIIFAMVFYFGEKGTTDSDGTVHGQVNGFPALLVFASWFLLFPVAEGLSQQTIGKALFGIRVVKIDYSKASMGSCLVRHLFDFVDYMPGFGIVGLLVAKNNEKKQRVGDLVAKTIVIVNKKE